VSTVFVDTSGFFALYARNDADHPQAVDLFPAG
jgi:predicted nucleic acid-binding protein